MIKFITSIFLIFILSCNFKNNLLEEYATLDFHKGDIWSLDFSPNNKHLVSGSADSKIVIWDINLKDKIKVFEEFYRAVYSVKYSNSGDFIVASSYDGLVKIIRLNENKVDTYKEHLLAVNNIDIHKSDKFVVSSGSDDRIKVWSTRNLKTFFDFQANNNIKIKVKHVKFSPDGYKVFYANTDGTLKIFNLKQDKIEKILDLKSGIISSIDFSPDSKEFACSFSDKKIRIYDSVTLKEKKSFLAHNWNVVQVKYSNNGKYIASISHDMKLNLWNRNGELLYSISPNLKNA
ncbi:MAG: hypothetical protein KatS3mg068_2188 [Candidatus Sericytochromatia bacterium]|nr:MAG: hypothetical protein KatS3mg068_2188 [Candidatus Sericytochromatia bacterium]